MSINPALWVLIGTNLTLFLMVHFCKNLTKQSILRYSLGLIGLISLGFAMLYAAYYLHLVHEPITFYQFRSLAFTDYLPTFSILALLFLPFKSRFRVYTAFYIFLILGLPYAKMILHPLDHSAMYDLWDGPVCKQSSPTSCGAAATATLLNHFGVKCSELEVAKKAYTSSTGTENWYLVRLMKNKGLNPQYQFIDPNQLPENLPRPAIAGVKINSNGHFITILDQKKGKTLVGDPFFGGHWHDNDELTEDFDFTGFFITFNSPNDSH